MTDTATFAAELRAAFTRKAHACQRLAQGTVDESARRAHFAEADTWTHASEMVAAAWSERQVP